MRNRTGFLSYRVARKGNSVIDRSPLGFSTNNGNFATGLAFRKKPRADLKSFLPPPASMAARSFPELNRQSQEPDVSQLESLISKLNRLCYPLADEAAFIKLYLDVHAALMLARRSKKEPQASRKE